MNKVEKYFQKLAEEILERDYQSGEDFSRDYLRMRKQGEGIVRNAIFEKFDLGAIVKTALSSGGNL